MDQPFGGDAKMSLKLQILSASLICFARSEARPLHLPANLAWVSHRLPLTRR